MNSRRDFLKTGLFSSGAMALMNPANLLAAGNKPPMRFIFMHRGNGLWPRVMVPPSFDEKLMEIPGWKTVEKRSSGREWTVEDAKVRSYLARNGLKVDDYAPRKTITVAAADKLLKKDGRTLKEDKFRKKPSSGTTLVRDGDPRPAARSHASRAASLAAATEKLAAEN